MNCKPAGWDRYARIVRELAAKCFVGPPSPEVEALAEAEARLLEPHAPANLGLRTLTPWLDSRGVDPDPQYRNALRHALVCLRMARGHREGRRGVVFEERRRTH